MPRKPNPPPDNAEQSKRFLETAKALEVDKAGKLFDATISKIIPKKPEKQKSQSDAKKR